jgi:hypothetical protein
MLICFKYRKKARLPSQLFVYIFCTLKLFFNVLGLKSCFSFVQYVKITTKKEVTAWCNFDRVSYSNVACSL